MNFVSVNQAHKLIRDAILTPKVQNMSLLDSLNHFTSAEIIAPLDVPSFDNSAMDGYGISFADLDNFDKFKITDIIQAGDGKMAQYMSGEAIRIFTGAPMPASMDTVVAQEDCQVKDGFLFFDKNLVKLGNHVRLKGSQTEKGTVVVSKNTQINAGIIGFLAGFGFEKIEIYQKPRVGIIITGKELVKAGSKLEYGQIYETNGLSLTASLLEIGIKPEFVHYIDDDLDLTKKTIKKSLETTDVLILTGGISEGDYDFVQEALIENDVEKIFYKIKQKPGKPLFFGTLSQKVIFALPGNPASVFTGFHIYVKPFLFASFSDNSVFITEQNAVLSNEYAKKSGLTHWVKGVYQNGGVKILKGQESYKMDAFVQANVLVKLDSEIENFVQGDMLTVIPI